MFGDFIEECFQFVRWLLGMTVPGFNFNMLSFICFMWALYLIGHLIRLVIGDVPEDKGGK